MIQFDEHIFQMGWFNHHLATTVSRVVTNLRISIGTFSLSGIVRSHVIRCTFPTLSATKRSPSREKVVCVPSHACMLPVEVDESGLGVKAKVAWLSWAVNITKRWLSNSSLLPPFATPVCVVCFFCYMCLVFPLYDFKAFIHNVFLESMICPP